ncbi:MAG: hypothetical protein M1833_002194 [Piccolia ochrophora]|nr:MAG: hypothetical protein M1833_002194 [Piccolia ochrophora]
MSQPLLSSRPSSEHSDEQAQAEDSLLTGARTGRHATMKDRYGWAFWREVGLFIWAMLATAAVIIIAVLYQHQSAQRPSGTKSPGGKRNMIFMVSDGMGPSSMGLTRSFKQFESGLAYGDTLVLDKHHIGSSRTRSTSSLITDSAAGATAFSCGMKSYNGAISVLPDHSPCGTVLEAAKKAGYMTGLVVTTSITDATPACFAAHVHRRSEQDRIAQQEVGDHPLGRVVDLIFGGGRCHFLPNNTDGSCRDDDTDVVDKAKTNGFDYIDDRNGFDGLKKGSAVNLPLLGLFAETDFPFEVDRLHKTEVYPSLEEMSMTAMRALTAATEDSDKGFFLMIEGSRIDHAGHGNDPAAQVHEVLAYDKAFASVVKFVEDEDMEAAVVSTSDHETGGLALAKQLSKDYPEYVWYPDQLVNATHSGENLAARLRDHTRSASSKDTAKFIREELIEDGLGIYDATDDEIKALIDHPEVCAYTFADMISRRAQVGWSTHGHSSADVNIYGTASALDLKGNHENTEIGEFIRDYLELDLGAITQELKDKGIHLEIMGEGWMGELPGVDERLDGDSHYEGHFKHKH